VLTIWTTTLQQKVYQNLSPVLKSVPGLPITIVKDYSVPEGTTLIFALGGGSLKKLQEEKIVAKNRALTSYVRFSSTRQHTSSSELQSRYQ